MAVPAERVDGLRVEVVERELVRVLDVLLERLEHAAGGELAVEAVVHQEQVWRRAAGERRREARDQIVTVARLDELDVDVRLFFGERADQRAVRLDLRRVAEDEKAHRAGGVVVAPAPGREPAQSGKEERHHERRVADHGRGFNPRCDELSRGDFWPVQAVFAHIEVISPSLPRAITEAGRARRLGVAWQFPL